MTAAVLAPRVRPVEGLRQSVSLSWRTLVQIKHNPMELIDFSLQPIMFLLLFTYVFGGAVAGSPGEYLTFALPGLIVQNALFGTLNTGVGLCNDLTKGVFDRLRALPIARWAPLTGRIVADVVKQAWAMALLLGLGAIMGFRVGTSVAGLLGAFGVLLGVVLAFSWISVLVGVLVKEPERVMVFGFAVMFPLTFVSNVFVPTDTMPGWLQAWVNVNPVTIVADAIRGLLVSGPVGSPVTGSLLWALGILVVFGPLSVRAFRRRA
ncbi:ABC transporter permease [Actinophytocola oryzae]|uniref:Transport permease protein n=1 Tax=Actinophytocola oryzae TaxID=502181 RepID=A0A4R7V8I3_9PSEU|nr:ABC transporter permease [Actinophytocola oryzae]TDV44876.1 oleandomycin transport system permease protein [Actinophytocola oryzae]